MPYGSNFPALNFRTTGPWGPGNGLDTGGRLTNTQADENIDELGLAIEDLRDNPPAAVGISNITSTASSFTIHLADSRTYGPFALPIASLSFQGEWTTATSYQTNDIVKVTGDGVYLVLQDHTSAATFDSAAADSDGAIYLFMIGAGADGADGTNGTNGADGADGATWFTGIGAPSASDGVEGDFYFDQGDSDGTGEGDIYQHQGSDAWVLIASTKGETGATGAQGPTGAGANIIVEEGTVALGTAVSNLNFDGDDFNVTQDSDGTANVSLASSGGGGTAISSAVVYVATNYTANLSSSTAINFTAEDSDPDDWHDLVTNPSRLTVPAGLGITEVKILAKAYLSGAGSRAILSVNKNGASDYRLPVCDLAPGVGEFRITLTSLSIPVVPGDYFELSALTPGDTSTNIIAGVTAFVIEGY